MNTNEYITIEEEIPERKPITKDAFSDFFNEKLERLNSAAIRSKSGRPDMKKRDIADMIGVSYEVFRKYINKEKPTERRDCIIAICAVLGATAQETNDGLYYYGMDELARGWKRDEAIMELLGNDEKPRTVDEINDGLIERGFDELDIIHHKGIPKETVKKTKYPYKLKRKKFEIPEIDFINDDLHFVNRTDIRWENVRAFMEFSDKGDPITIWTEITDYDSASGIEFMFYVHDPRNSSCHKYTDPELTGEFQDCFAELQKTALAEMKKLNRYYNDTKNFRYLTSAKVIDNELHFFAEAYNNNLLFSDEYYLMDYCNGKQIMTVSSKSRFLRLFLTEEEYKRRFPNNPDNIIAIYTEDPDKSENENISAKVISRRSDYYRELEGRIEKMMQSLYNGELYICGFPYPTDSDNIYSIIDDIEPIKKDVCKAFDCILEKVPTSTAKTPKNVSDTSELDSMDFDDLRSTNMLNGEDISTEYHHQIVGVRNESPEFTLSGGEKVKLTVQDLIDGMNLGLETIDEIGYFKLKHSILDPREIIYYDENFVLYSDNYNGYATRDEKIDALINEIEVLIKNGATQEDVKGLYFELEEACNAQNMIDERIIKCLNKKISKVLHHF